TNPCLNRHRHGLPGLERTPRFPFPFGAKSSCLDGGRSRQSSGMEGGDDSRRILVDHREQRAGWRLWHTPSAFPMLDGIQAEAEGVGKAGLSHVELVADAFHIDFIGHVHLEALPLSCKKSLHLIQSSHELFKRSLHRLSPVAVKTRFFRALRSALVRLAFLFFGKTVIRKAGNLSLRQRYTTR